MFLLCWIPYTLVNLRITHGRRNIANQDIDVKSDCLHRIIPAKSVTQTTSISTSTLQNTHQTDSTTVWYVSKEDFNSDEIRNLDYLSQTTAVPEYMNFVENVTVLNESNHTIDASRTTTALEASTQEPPSHKKNKLRYYSLSLTESLNFLSIALNPWMYSLLNRSFRKGLMTQIRILTTLFRSACCLSRYNRRIGTTTNMMESPQIGGAEAVSIGGIIQTRAPPDQALGNTPHTVM